TAPLLLTARDTGGRAIPGQRPAINVGTVAGGVFSSAQAVDPVTVVSAPAADVILTAPPSFTLDANNRPVTGAGPLSWNNAAAGMFVATPVPMTWAGYSPHKGHSISGAWSGYLDVESFPAETIWTIGGVVVARDGNNRIALGSNSGAVTVNFSIPGGWPYQPEGSTEVFPARVIVSPGSFSNDPLLLNNGNDWQPGDSQGPNFNTLDPARNTHRGMPFANNDFSAVRVSRPRPSTPPSGGHAGTVAMKSIHGPWDSTRTIWEQENIEWGAATISERAGVVANRVAPGTELESRLRTYPRRLAWEMNPLPQQLVVGDLWDTNLQILDLSRPVAVTFQGNPVPPADFQVQWHESPRTAAQLADLADAGWTTTPTTAARAMRVVFVPGAIPFDAAHSASVEVRVPFQVRPDAPLELDGASITNQMVSVRIRDGVPHHSTSSRSVVLAHPGTPRVLINNVITHIDGHLQGTTPQAQAMLSAGIGEIIQHRLSMYAFGLVSTSDPVTPTVTVELDPCATNPVNQSTWAMQTIPGVAGPSGRICGDPLATPIRLVFTPAGPGSTLDLDWTAFPHPDYNRNSSRMLGEGRIRPDILFSVEISAVSQPGVPVVNNATIEIEEAPLPDSDEAQVAVRALDRTAARVQAEWEVREVDDTISFQVDLWTLNQLVDAGRIETVIVLPRNGDGHLLYPGFVDRGYDGSLESSFAGDFTLVGAEIDWEHTSDDVEMFFTLNPDADFDPENSTWLPVAGADPAVLAQATALRVVADFVDQDTTVARIVNITIQPSGNEPDDVYILWLGPILSDGADAYRAFPAETRVVASEICGMVWWDTNADGAWQVGEEHIEGVRVTLHHNDGGQPGAPVLDRDGNPMYAYTDAMGRYEFARLRAGEYLAVVHRGPGTPIANYTTSFFQLHPTIDPTYVAFGLLGANARAQGDQQAVQNNQPSTVASTVISLGIDSRQCQVDFGFHAQDPMIALDKSNASIPVCEDGVCQVYWDIRVTNVGTTPLSGVTLYDRMSETMFDTWATGMTPLRALQVGMGRLHGAALLEDGTVAAWGEDSGGLLGRLGQMHSGGDVWNWGFSGTAEPGLVRGVGGNGVLEGIVQISVGNHTTLALGEDGTVYGWGRNHRGQVGVPPAAYPNQNVGCWPVSPEPSSPVAWGTTGEVWCEPLPVRVPGLPGDVVEVVAGNTHSLAVTAEGHVYAWGSTQLGRLGEGTVGANEHSDMSHVPQRVRRSAAAGDYLTGVVQAAAGAGHSLAVTGDGLVYTWGSNSSGALGLGGATDLSNYRAYATQIPSLSNIVQVAAGSGIGNGQIINTTQLGGGSFAVTADGGVYAWGNNTQASLGLGTTGGSHPLPQRVLSPLGSPEPYLEGVVSVTTGRLDGGWVTTALTAAGTAYSWGSAAQAGTGTSGNLSRPAGVLAPFTAG
ncbi:MAG: hypothetical protein FWG11_06770, partial [Promicromonosporaceae bacterium]|nr:hypothetical protein [Promicromonosporaceae bacterium]